MQVSAKFNVVSITDYLTSTEPQSEITFTAFYGKDGKGNVDWSKYTPNGTIKMTVTNPAAIEEFRKGGAFKFTFERDE